MDDRQKKLLERIRQKGEAGRAEYVQMFRNQFCITTLYWGPAGSPRRGVGGDEEERTVYALSVEGRRMMGHRKAIDIREGMMYFHLPWKLLEMLFDVSRS